MPRRDQAWLNAYEAKQRDRHPEMLKKSGGVDREKELQKAIVAECNKLGWICLRSRMDRETTRMEGEPDLTILAADGLVLWLECKTANGKLSLEQAGFIGWAARLGHTVCIVRSMDDFFSILRDLDIIK